MIKGPKFWLTDFVLFSSILTYYVAAPLSCGSCESVTCPVLIDCPYGIVEDPCQCCAVCAQPVNSICGGNFELLGKCGIGFYCSKKLVFSNEFEYSSAIGVCKECMRTQYTGCNLVHGLCQCGESCTQPFLFADRQSCEKSADSDSACQKKICPKDDSDTPCPEYSERLPKKLSVDGCCELSQKCQCKKPNYCPDIPKCSNGTKLATISQSGLVPGRCCESYQCVNDSHGSCDLNGKTYRNGEPVPRDTCNSCVCLDGVLRCNETLCPALNTCGWMARLPGSCCSICIGCVSSKTGKYYVNGEAWHEDDSCTSCMCIDGDIQCAATVCVTSCEHPQKVQGLCCPVCTDNSDASDQKIATIPTACEGFTKCDEDCGSKVFVEFEGCDICLCEDDLSRCDSSCTKSCPTGYKKDPTHNCSLCECVTCPPLRCDLICKHSFKRDSQNCLLCECEEAPQGNSKVCHSHGGKAHSSGDSWFDGCHSCYCQNGEEFCSLISCPVVTCKQPMTRAGDCCPSCPSVETNTKALNLTIGCTDSNGYLHADNELWQFDSCTKCLCYNGQALCETERCPPTLCSHPVKLSGKCCSECPDQSQAVPVLYKKQGSQCVSSFGYAFSHGDVWKVGDCQSCTCRDGAILCFTQVCPSLSCQTTVFRKGQCCSQCAGDQVPDKVCLYKGNSYYHLESWTESGSRCVCYHGNFECKNIQCEKCNNPPTVAEGGAGQALLGLPLIVTFSVLLLLFAVVIVLLTILLIYQRRKRKTKLKVLPKLLQQRTMKGPCDSYNMKRPKSTNLEFLHATHDNKYNTAISRGGDMDCFRPLVDHSLQGNEYVHC